MQPAKDAAAMYGGESFTAAGHTRTQQRFMLCATLLRAGDVAASDALEICLTSHFGSTSGIQTGTTYGRGVEYALPTASFLDAFHSNAITVKTEYLLCDLGHANFSADGLTTATAYATRSKTECDLARVCLNYKF